MAVIAGQRGDEPSADSVGSLRPFDDDVVDLLERVADGVVVVDRNGRIVHMTRRACDLFGHAPGGLTGELVERLVPHASRSIHARVRQGYAEDPKPREMGTGLPLEGLRADGSVVGVDIRLEPMASGHYLVASVRPSDVRPPDDELDSVRHREQELRALLDDVTQHLFAVGMSLAALQAQVPELAEQLSRSGDLIDRTIDLARAPIERHGD